MTPEDMTEDVVQALADTGDHSFKYHLCSICNTATMVLLSRGAAMFDSSCACARMVPSQISIKDAARILQETGFPEQFEKLKKPVTMHMARPYGYAEMRKKARYVGRITDGIAPDDIVAAGPAALRHEVIYYGGNQTVIQVLEQEIIYWRDNHLCYGLLRS
jgi:hypothetical protein